MGKKNVAKLFNDDVEKGLGSETYYTILMEQWKTANEMAADVSNKRATMNNFFTTLFAAMISAIVALVGIIDVSALVMLFGSVLGVALCFLWRSTIQGYKLLNKAKFEVINEIEKKLPANVMQYEWDGIIGNPERTEFKNYSGITKTEKYLVYLFLGIFSCTFILSVICLIFPGLF